MKVVSNVTHVTLAHVLFANSITNTLTKQTSTTMHDRSYSPCLSVRIYRFNFVILVFFAHRGETVNEQTVSTFQIS